MKQITAVGVDVSKVRSMIAVRQYSGVILAAPFKVNHTAQNLRALIFKFESCKTQQRRSPLLP